MADEMDSISFDDQDEVTKARKVFGQAFKRLREGRNYSLPDLSNQTRISLEFIVALEEGDFSALPGQVFGRGFLKSLLKVIGSQDTEILELYSCCWNREDSPPGGASPRPQFLGQRSLNSRIFFPLHFSRRIQGLVFVLGLVLILVAAVFFSVPGQKPPSVVEIEEAEPIAESVLQGQSEPILVDRKPVEEQAVETVTAETEPAPLQKSTLVIVVKEDTRIRLQGASVGKEDRVFSPGRYTYEFKDYLEILPENTNNVEIFFNEKQLGLQGVGERQRWLRFLHDNQSLPLNAKTKVSSPQTVL